MRIIFTDGINEADGILYMAAEFVNKTNQKRYMFRMKILRFHLSLNLFYRCIFYLSSNQSRVTRKNNIIQLFGLNNIAFFLTTLIRIQSRNVVDYTLFL